MANPTIDYTMNEKLIYTYNTEDQQYHELDVSKITKVKIECYGASVANKDGTDIKALSKGGYTYGILDTTDIDKLYIYVGQTSQGRRGGWGWGLGGSSHTPRTFQVGLGGAGCSAVVTDPDDTNSVLMVAGGAGGGTNFAIYSDSGKLDDHGNKIQSVDVTYIPGGNGGGWTGTSAVGNYPIFGVNADVSGHSGHPGTQTGPGIGEQNGAGFTDGHGNTGGDGYTDNYGPNGESIGGGGNVGGSAGGGGGFYGGGGGCICGSGGSSYVAGNPNCPKQHPNGYKFTDSGTTTGGNPYVDGKVIITVLSVIGDPFDIESTVFVYQKRNNISVNIPFPYKQFTDMPFFITDKNGRLISERYYVRDNETTLRFKDNNPLGLNKYEDIRFTFCHNREKYAIKKFELNFITEDTVYRYEFKDSPYYSLLDLNTRFKVFYDRNELVLNQDCYINIYEGFLQLDTELVNVQPNKEITILCFYTGNKYTRAIQDLPMSGYIYLKKHLIDRNYSKDRMAVFVNGKLVPSKYMIDMSNNIHKISKDIQSRYNMEILNLSPKINSLVPFYKKNYYKLDIPEQYRYYDFPCIINILKSNIPHNRWYLDDDCNPIIFEGVLSNPDWYITLIHHGYKDTAKSPKLSYTLKFFKDDYDETPSNVNVITQLSYPTNDYEYNSDTSLLMGKINNTIHELSYDFPLLSISISTIIRSDIRGNKPPDGVLCRLEINKSSSNNIQRVYYELNSNDFEFPERVGIFEWVITDQPDGKGHVYYRKTVWLRPNNLKHIEDEVDEEENT